MKLPGQVALVTGANQGLGAQIAARFVREGAHVVLCARGAPLLSKVAAELAPLAAGGQQVVSEPLDVTREADVDRVVARTLERLGRIDILVNCAGTAGPRGAVDELDWAAWKDAITINLMGTVYPTRAVLAGMKRQRHGKIINISGGGATKPLPHLSAYAASKAAVVRFTETVALEVKDWHIDVNAVAPGVLYTKLVDDFVEAGEAQLGSAYFAEVQRQKSNPKPAFDLATGLCVYLASGESDGITGKLISANWDPWADLAKHRAELMAGDIYALRRITPADRGQTWGEKKP